MVTTPWGCAGSDEVRVARGCYLDIPNAFSPNGDGINDYFFPRQSLSQGISSFRMEVRNRWGQVLFVTTDIRGRGWDGYFNGIAQPAGVYVYSLALHYTGQPEEVFHGNVTLIR
jgi:gliding motility-associated-like protein